MITTIYGDMDENDLVKSEGVIEDDNERTTWVEYRLNDELVHRSVHITLKTGVAGIGEVGNLE